MAAVTNSRQPHSFGKILAASNAAVSSDPLIISAIQPSGIYLLKDVLLVLTGLVLVLVSIKGRIWAALYLGSRMGKTLVTNGPYARSRHPLYFYSLLGTSGIAAASGMITVVAAVLLFFLVAHLLVIRTEERKLLLAYGDEYRHYCDEVPRFWPVGAHDAEPERQEFRPQQFHRAFWDSVGFLAGWLMVCAAHVFHAVQRLSD
jgi:protein-S-isoprenylcysteine O-methyltransferase Ste14